MKKVVFITGASSGIGRVSAEYLFSKGYKVYGTCRNPELFQVPFELIPMELTDKRLIKNAIDFVVKKEGKIDVLVNNAGIGITGPIEDTPSEEIKKAFAINLFGTLEVIQQVLPSMREQKSGLIINITSIAAYMGLPFRGIYCATKSALEIASETLSMEVKAFGIKISNIAPGDFSTNIAKSRYHTPFYENSAYVEEYKRNLELLDSHVEKGADPIWIAKKIHKIIQTGKPKLHYKVGSFMQKFSIVLKYILPDRMYEKMMLNYYGMK